jgi:alpha-glucosidase (family GH31 glycosyl hydrolase)
LLVAPVVEKEATHRKVYLPRGGWYDFWTGERMDGGRELERLVDLETIPLYVRAGSILPLDPVKQFTGEKVDRPLTVVIYPGADATFLLYEDDGRSFDYRKANWMGLEMTWDEKPRVFSLQLAPGSQMLPPNPRPIIVKLADSTRFVSFAGVPLKVSFLPSASSGL